MNGLAAISSRKVGLLMQRLFPAESVMFCFDAAQPGHI